MGNKSSSDYGSIYLRTDKPEYYAGEVVTGTVYLDVRQPNYPANMVLLKIKGLEYVHWTETRQGPNNTTYTENFQGSSILFSNKVPLFQFNSASLPVGQYQFPFQYQTQPNLPGSYDNGYKPRTPNANYGSRQHSGLTAYIQYIFGAQIYPQSGFKPMKYGQELIINEPQKQQAVQLLGTTATDVKFCGCCCSKGVTKLTAQFNKSHFFPVDQAIINISVDNSASTIEIQKIELKLKNYVTVRSNCGRARNFVDVIHEEYLNGLQPHEVQPNITSPFNLNNFNSGIQIKGSANGSIIQNSMGCCNTDVTVEVPIVILTPPVPSYAIMPQQPQNWNPQTFQPLNVVLMDQNRYQGKKELQMLNYPRQ